MNGLDIHEVVDIKREMGSHPPFNWCSLTITDADGKQFQITLFGKEENLKIKEESK